MRPTDKRGIILPVAACAIAVVLGAVPGAASPYGAGVDVSAAGLGDAAERALIERGAVVVPSGQRAFPEVYESLDSRGFPVFITTDSVLLTTRLFVDGVLAHVEREELHERLEVLSRELVRISEQQYIVASEPMVKEAARRNLAYFAVGLSLLDPDYFPSEFVRGLVERELALIEDARSLAYSPIMGPTPLDDVAGPGEDYTAYAPSGHYAADERMMRFGRALTWYGRMAFALPEGRVEDRVLTVQALLVVRALMGEGGEWLELWEHVQEPLCFFLGASGDPTVRDYMDTSVEVYGDEFDPEILADEELLDQFISIVGESAPPHFDTHQLRGMRFLCRRDYPDAGTFGRLARGEERELPSLLDLMSLIGSPEARSVLEDQDAFGSEIYRRGYDEIEVSFDTMTYGEWTRDLYWNWLYALSASFRERAGGPDFLRADGWKAKSLATAAASWAALRDMPEAPAARPTAGPRGAVGPAGAPPLVEPAPVLYSRLRELVENMEDRLVDHYLVDDVLRAELAEFCVFLTTLEHFSIGVLDKGGAAGSAPMLRDYAATMRVLSRGAADSRLARAVTVYLDHDSGSSLLAAIGDPDIAYVICDTPDGSMLYAGAVFSFYEIREDDDRAQSDLAWRSRLDTGTILRPWWTLRIVEE